MTSGHGISKAALERARHLGERRDAFEVLRDIVAEQYRDAVRNTWRLRRGSNVSHTGKLASAAIDARDFRRARKDGQTRVSVPQ